MEETTIRISRDSTLPDVVASIKRGEWKIPRFQREFVWEKKRVIGLLDSIYKEFPIGAFFLWIPPEEYVSHYKDIPELGIEVDNRKYFVHFILDGQQRLTSLYAVYMGLTINEQNFSSICFNLDSEKFNLDSEDLNKNISVHKILNEEKYSNLYDNLTPDKRLIFRKIRDRFQKYPFPVVIIEKKNVEEAIKIFERINQSGKKLSIFDLLVAITWDKDFDLRKEVAHFNEEIEGTFGKIEPEIFGETLSLIIKKQCTKAFQLKLTSQEVKEKWNDVKEAIKGTIQFLRTNLNVKHYSLLPYTVFIPLIAYYLFYEKNNNINKEFLKLWFWKASFGNRYSGSSFTLMGEDRAHLFDKILSGEEVEINYDINIDIGKIKNVKIGIKSSLRNAIILIFLQQNPLSFKDNTPIDIENDFVSKFNKSEKHHIFPKKFLSSLGIKDIDNIANFCLIDSNLNKYISAKAPKDYFTEFKGEYNSLNEALHSHLIPAEDDSGIWTNNYNDFIEQRAELILRQIKQRVGDFSATTEEQMNSNPQRIIEKLEQMIRENILSTLYEDYGEDWWTNDEIVAPDIRQYAKEKINREKASKPYVSDEEWKTISRMLEQLTIPHYVKIILKNWNLFEEVYGAKNEVESHFNNFSKLRNQISHFKTIDPTERKIGESSIGWIFKCLQTKTVNEAEENITNGSSRTQSSNSETRHDWDEEKELYGEIRKVYIEVIERKLRSEISNLWDEALRLIKERTEEDISEGTFKGLTYPGAKYFDKDGIHSITYWQKSGGLQAFLKAKEEWKSKGWC